MYVQISTLPSDSQTFHMLRNLFHIVKRIGFQPPFLAPDFDAAADSDQHGILLDAGELPEDCLLYTSRCV